MENMIHTFEEAGLGKAPFKFIGVEEKTYQAHPTAPIQPGGICAYCGTPLIECCLIQDTEGKIFIVGSTCVNKTGDRGLINFVKREVNRKRKAVRLERESQRIVNAKNQWKVNQAVRSLLSRERHPNDYIANTQGKTLADYVDYLFQYGGHSGQFRVAKLIEKSLCNS